MHPVGTHVENSCEEAHEQGHPAQDVRPGKAPVPKAATQEADSDSSVNGQGQQDEKGWGEEDVGGSRGGGWVWRWGGPEIEARGEVEWVEVGIRVRTLS